MKTVSTTFLREIEKPNWRPITRVYMLDSGDSPVEITKQVANINRLLWQVEQSYKINEFSASNCRLELKNENAAFDISNGSNYFVSMLGREQDGQYTPVKIQSGYVLPDETEELIDLFYGYIVDHNISTRSDIVSFDVECVSAVLRKTPADDIGVEWADQQVYGGESYCYMQTTIGATDTEITCYNTPSGVFPDGFPPTGHIQIEDEKIYYSALSATQLLGCQRGKFDTRQVGHKRFNKVILLMPDGTETENVKFFFLGAPLCRESISSISSSDGDITLVAEKSLLGFGYSNRTGWVDYKQGTLELGGEPTDPTSITATYKGVFRQLSCHALCKEVLRSKGFDTTGIEEGILYDYKQRRVPSTYGAVTHVYSGDSIVALPNNASINALCVDNDDVLHLGIENYLVKWTGERFEYVANLPSLDDTILRLETDADNNFYGISGSKTSTSPREVFKYDGSFTTLASIAEYIDPHPLQGYYGGQFRNFSVDDDNGVVWFLYDDGSARGIAKVGFDGAGLTKYSRPAKIGVAPGFLANFMDFCDLGTTIEFFYAHATTGVMEYDTLTKGTGTWASNGTIALPKTDLAPCDVAYHEADDKIYFNAVQTYGYLVSVPVGSNVHTFVKYYQTLPYNSRARICGLVYHDGFLWGIEGAENARGVITNNWASDESTGKVWRIADNYAEDMGRGAGFLEQTERVLGNSARLAVRAPKNEVYLEYNGNNSSVNCGSDSSLDNLHDGILTLDTWIRFDGVGENNFGMIASKNGGGIGWSVYTQGENQLWVWIHCATTDSYARTLDITADGLWHHIAVTWDDDSYNYPRIWKDGVEVEYLATQNRSGAVVSDAARNFQVGRQPSPVNYSFNGAIGWVRLSDAILYDTDFVPPPRLTSPTVTDDTVEQWNFNEGSGATAAAQVSSNNDGTISNSSWVSEHSDDAIFFVSTDYWKQKQTDGYKLYRYSEQLATVVQTIDLTGRKVWDVLSELAVIMNYELFASSNGIVQWRKRSAAMTYLIDAMDDSQTTIATTGVNMEDFLATGIVSIDHERIYYGTKTDTTFANCTRGYGSSVAATHSAGAEIHEIHQILQNYLTDNRNLKRADKQPNWNEVFNHVIVPYGGLELEFDYEYAGEPYAGSSEETYGKRSITINNSLLSADDGLIAVAIGWRYYAHYNQRRDLLELETKWQPQLSLGDQIAIYQTSRNLLENVTARIRRIELNMTSFFMRIIATVPYRYQKHIYDIYGT